MLTRFTAALAGGGGRKQLPGTRTLPCARSAMVPRAGRTGPTISRCNPAAGADVGPRSTGPLVVDACALAALESETTWVRSSGGIVNPSSNCTQSLRDRRKVRRAENLPPDQLQLGLEQAEAAGKAVAEAAAPVAWLGAGPTGFPCRTRPPAPKVVGPTYAGWPAALTRPAPRPSFPWRNGPRRPDIHTGPPIGGRSL